MAHGKKTIKQIIAEVSAKKEKPVKVATKESFFGKRAKIGSKSPSLVSLISEASKGRKIPHPTDKMSTKQKLAYLQDSITELQSSYQGLDELFHNTVSSSDSTIASLLQDLSYTVSRLNTADFSLKYDVGSSSLFVDGEDSIAVSTPDVLSMLSYITSLFPNKSISLSIDGDADYTDGAALNKLEELNGSPAPSVSAVPPVQAPEDTDIDKVLTGVGDSKIKDTEFAPEDRFTCTYKEDTYSIWDKNKGILVKVETSPKEADAMLEGLVTGASSQIDTSLEGDPVLIEEDEVVLDSKFLKDSTILDIEADWSEAPSFDLYVLKEKGWSTEKVKAYIDGVMKGLFTPFFAQTPAFEGLVTENSLFDLDSDVGCAFVTRNHESTKQYNSGITGTSDLDAQSSFTTAYVGHLLDNL